MAQGCLVSGALGVLLRVSRVAGLAPVTFVREKDGWRIPRSRALRIYGNILITILILGSIGAIISDGMLSSEQSVFMVSRNECILWSLYRFSIIIFTAVSAYGSWDQMESMMNCLNKVYEVIQEVSTNLQPTSSERNKIIFTLSWLAVTLGLHILDLTILLTDPLNLTSSYKYWTCVMYIFCYLLTCVLIIQILQIHLIVYNISKIFVNINETMRDLLQVPSHSVSKKDTNIPHFDSGRMVNSRRTRSRNIIGVTVINCISGPEGSVKAHHETVRDLALAYKKNCIIMLEMQDYYGKILFLLLVYFLLQLILSPYVFFAKLLETTKNPNDSGFVSMAMLLIWCFYDLTNLILLIEPCHSTHAEMDVTKVLVSHLTLHTRSAYEPLALELETFYRLLMLNKTTYSPLNVITLSRSLVITIWSSIITYLVILFQDKA